MGQEVVSDTAPALLTVEPPIGSYGGTADAQIYAEGLSIIDELYIVEFEDDVQSEPALAVYQVSRGDSVAEKFTRIDRNGERDFLPSADSGKVRQILLPIYRERVAVVARGGKAWKRENLPYCPFYRIFWQAR